MASWDLGALARAAEADIRGGKLPVSIEAVGTDSRTLPPACLFVALRGEHFDGHAFVSQAVAKGARAVLVDRRARDLPALAVPALVVDDTLRALGQIARFARGAHGKPVVAVTGSNGKTTTKELVAAALACRGPIHKTEGNLNNLIGLPLTLLAWPHDPANNAWAGVLEMGMSAPGEIARLTEIAAPNVGIVTCVAAAHLGGLGSLEGVARAKGELFAGLAAGATAIANADDPQVVRLALPMSRAGRALRFGWAENADVRVMSAETRRGGRGLELAVEFRVLGAPVTARLPLVGRHNAANAAAALAAAVALGLPARDAAAGLESVAVPGSRLRVRLDIPPGVDLLDDTYNANPGSMRAALSTLADLAGSRRRIAVLGDMLELGPTSAELHRGVGEAAAAAGCALVLAAGEHAEDVAAGARGQGAQAQAFGDVEVLAAALLGELRPGDWILIKGSRGMRMERVVKRLCRETA